MGFIPFTRESHLFFQKGTYNTDGRNKRLPLSIKQIQLVRGSTKKFVFGIKKKFIRLRIIFLFDPVDIFSCDPAAFHWSGGDSSRVRPPRHRELRGGGGRGHADLAAGAAQQPVQGGACRAFRLSKELGLSGLWEAGKRLGRWEVLGKAGLGMRFGALELWRFGDLGVKAGSPFLFGWADLSLNPRWPPTKPPCARGRGSARSRCPGARCGSCWRACCRPLWPSPRCEVL